jgi:hypothetical protein
VTALQSTDHLELALDALGSRQAGVAAAIRAAGPHPGLDLAASRSGALTGTLDGVPLASRHQPVEEARRMVDRLDLAEHAVVIVHGFGLGHHVAELCRRMGRTGVVIVLEPDHSLLHSVLGAIDHAAAFADANIVLVTDPADRASLARVMQDAEWLFGQGICFLDHPPSRARLEPAIRVFGETLTGLATHVRLTLSTTLIRSVDTVRNLTGNLARYATAPGIAELAGVQAGRPAILVAAGPSLGPTLDRLADPRVREHAVIIAAQTTLRPLLARGIRPHFVTALDYHRISTRFYEGLTREQVAGVELVVDPKAHPSILEAFPGTVRCCRAAMLDTLLGDGAREMGELPSGATVAHLSAYLARHLGCDPIITVGQDLAFTDGLYYGAGAVIHDVWGPELGPFNPITTMEWQRIARHRPHLQRVEAWDGGSVLSDAQMVTYRQQFERDFAADAELGRRVIDATGSGGARKHGAERMDLAEAIKRFATEPLSPMPRADREVPDAETRRRAAREQLDAIRGEVADIRAAAQRSGELIDAMLDAQDDPAAMQSLFGDLSAERRTVETRMRAFRLIEHLNQLGTFKRVRADRRLALAGDLSPRDRQRAELERDQVNVAWIGDAADELQTQLAVAAGQLAGDHLAGRGPVDVTPPPPAATMAAAAIGDHEAAAAAAAAPDAPVGRVGAVVAVDLADAPRLAHGFGDASLLEATLRRLARSRRLDAIVLVIERGAQDILPIPARVGDHELRVITVDDPPVGARGRAIRVARAGAAGAWRGGIAGFGGADDGLSPRALRLAIEAADLAAVIPCGPDRPLLDPDRGVDALIDRWREHPGAHRLVFTPLPPGLGAVLLRRDLALDLESAGRFAGVGPMLIHHPHVAQGDPITTDACVAVTPTTRRHLDVIAGDDGARQRLAAVAARLSAADGVEAVIAALDQLDARVPVTRPSHLVLELVTGGTLPPWRRRPGAAPAPRIVADPEVLIARLRDAGRLDGTLVTLTGDEDPLAASSWRAVAEAARAAGATVHLRTALDVSPDVAAALASAPVDIVSVELHAHSADTWRTLHDGDDGDGDGLARVHAAIDALVAARTPLDAASGPGALALPWIVPRMQRRPETLAEVEAFHEHWQRTLGTAVLEPAWPDEAAIAAGGSLAAGTGTGTGTDTKTDAGTDAGTPAASGPRPILALDTPPAIVRRELRGRMRILAGGTVPRDDRDRTGATSVAAIRDTSLLGAWAALQRIRGGAAAADDGLLEP